MAPRAPLPWSLTASAFERLLDHLGPNRDSAAREYERLRQQLGDYLDFHGSPSPEADADEVLVRVARKLEQGELIHRVSHYTYGVAKLVALESKRRHAQQEQAARGMSRQVVSPDAADNTEAEDADIACMEKCLGELPAESRAFIMAYCREALRSPLHGRKLLAQQLGLRYGTIKTRAHRIRAQLEECLDNCLSEGRGTS